MSDMSREEAIDYLEWIRPKKPYTQDKKNVQTAIDMSIEALKERPHGEWIYDVFDENYHCSECNRVGATIYPFCPNCGASMRKEGEAE